MADIQRLLGYAIVGGIGLALGYVIFSKPTETPGESIQPAGVGTFPPTRWTSGYHGPAYGRIYPAAGVAEALYPYGEYHKMTGFSPGATLAGIKNGTNGSMIYID